MKVGVSATREPFSFTDEKGRITGFDGEVARRIAAKLGRPVEFLDMKFSALIPALHVVQETYGNVTYQWLKDGDPVPGAIGPVYNIAYAQLMDEGEYVCRVSDDSPATADSPAAVVTVNPRPPVPAASAAALAGLALALAALGARRHRS